MAYATRRSTTTVRRDVAQEISEKFIAAIEKAIETGGTAPWAHPWTSSRRPMSMSSGKPYQGINYFILSLSAQLKGYTSPWFGTYNQITELGGQVRKGNCDKSCKTDPFADCGGNHGTQVVLYKTWSKTEEVDGELVDRTIPVMRAFSVFNASQCDWEDGKGDRWFPQPGEVREIPSAQSVVDGYLAQPGAPELFHDVEGQAHFIPARNEVHVPVMASHKTPDKYFCTLFHELTHAADFKIRRNAEEAEHGRSKATYAVGELVAEMGASFLAAETGVEADFDNSVSYLRGWLRALKDDKKFVIKAAAAAQRATSLILGEAVAETTEADLVAA